MAETFEDLGIRSELVGVVRDEEGYEAPTALQSAAVPVLRRGGNAVLYGSAGAGVVATYGLGVLDRLAGGVAEGEAGVRALVLTATREAASPVAASLARLARAVGIRVAALGAGWPGAVDGAEVVVASPDTALEAVRTSQLKLEGVDALVLDGAAAVFALGAGEAVETLTGLVSREAQRVVVAAEATAAVEDYIERHVRRALRMPPVPVEPAARVGAEPTPSRVVEYLVPAGPDREEAVAGLLAERPAGRPAVVYCRTARRAEAVADRLSLRGFLVARDVGEVDEAGERVVVTAGAVEPPAEALIVSYDVPLDAESLAARHTAGGVVVVAPRELSHLRQIAARAGFEPRARTVAGAAPALDEIGVFRDRLRQALVEEDLGVQLLVLDPLLKEFPAAEVAAAASALLRRRLPVPPPVAGVPVAPAAPVRPTAAPAPPAPPTQAWARLFIGVGSRDGVSPGDLVGAITGEASVPGSAVGRIDIRENFSIVEVVSDVADRVIRSVNGTTLRGRSVRVDYDRRGAGPARKPPERMRRPPRGSKR